MVASMVAVETVAARARRAVKVRRMAGERVMSEGRLGKVRSSAPAPSPCILRSLAVGFEQLPVLVMPG